MACYKITVNGKELPFKFATQAEAQNAASKLVSNPGVPSSFKAKVGNSDYLDYRKLEEFMMYDTMYSLSYNSLTYGDISLGHKDSIDVVKRNGNLPSDGLSLGYGKAKTAIIKSTKEIVDGREIDTQDAQTYASPHWYLNKYLKATSKADKEVVRIYKEKIIPGFELTPEEVATLKAAKADLTDRKIVVRTHFDLIKTAFHIQSREKVSKLRNDTPQERQNIIKLYELAEQAQTLEDKRKILERIHEKYDPIYKYHHDMLNTIELNELDYLTVDSSAKLLQHNVGNYDANAGFRIAPYYISDHFIREQMQTDRKSMSTVHGSQMQGLFFGEQDETLEIETPKGKTTVGQIVERYFKIKADRTQKTREKILEDLITDDGDLNFDEVVNVIMSQSNAAQGDAVRAALMEVIDNNPNVSLNNSLLSKDFATALMSKLDKSLKTKVPGKAYTLVSDVGHNVFIDEKGNIVPRKNWRPGLQQRRLDFNKKEGDLYYAEVIVSEEILTKLGVTSIEEANEALFGLGVRIPTEGKNSSVIIKIVDTLPSTYSSTLIAPPELLLYSGADFDIDKLYVRHYSLSSDKKKFGHYLTLKSKAARLKRAKQEYLESTGKAVPENFEELVEANYADPLNSTPLTIEEGNNDLLDMEMYMAYNQHTESQAKYENSLAVLKDIMVPFLKQGQLAADVKDANTVYTTLDKLLAQESIDIGKDNIGVAAVANIMNTLLSRHKYDFGTAYNKNRAFGVSEVDLADTKLDSKGLTTNGKMRLPALIAVLLNAMTDNAKEQLAYDLSLDKKNLATYLYGISIGIDPKTMLISIQDLDSMPNVRPEVLKYLTAKQEQRDEIIKELKGQNREDAIEYLEVADKVYNSIDDVDIRNLFSLRQPFLGLTLDDSIGISKLLMMQTNRSIEKFSTDLFDLINVRALVKGISKDFVSLDNVLTSIEEVGVGYTKGETTNEDNLYSRVFTKGDDVYYRPVLGQKEVVKYTFTYAGGFGNIIKNQPDVFELIATAIVYDNEIFGKVSLKRNSIVRNYFGFTGYKYNNFLNAEDRDSLVNSFVNYIPSRIYENKYNIAIDTTEGARKEALQYIRDNIRNFNLVYHPFDQQSKLAKLREKLIAPDSVFNNNLFVNSLIVKTTNTKNPKFKATTISIDTLNEVTSGHKDMVASDFQVLNRVKIPATSLKELDSKPVEDLTNNEAAYLFALYVQEYSLLIENSSYRKGSLTTVLPKETVFNVYKQLNAVDELFKEYASKSADKNFYKRFKELTGTEFERFYIEFMEYEAANNGYKALARKIKNFKTLKEVNAYTPKSTFIDRTVTLKNGTKRKINLQTIVTADMLRFDTDTVNSNTLFKNRYFVRGHEYQGYKPMVFPPSLKSSGPTLFISRIVAADIKGDLYEYVYDRGQVYKTKVDEKYQPISDTVETDFMPMSGIRADYSPIKRYSDRILSNSLSPAAFHAKKAEFAVETDKPVDTETQLDINDSQTDGEYEGSAFIQSGPLGQMSGQQPTEQPQVGVTSVKNIFTVEPRQAVDKKAKSKAKIATQYIGFAEGISGSSTALYAEQAGQYANTGNYNSNDVIFVSVPGKRGSAELQKQNQDKTIKEAIKAVEAGATIITDNKEYIDSNSYNTGEKRLFANMQSKGYTYSEVVVDGQTLGTWSKLTQQQPTQQTINIYAGTGENAELSNLAKRPFIDEGIRDLGINYLEVTGKPIKWNTVEGAYQAEKLMYSDDYSDKSKEAWTLNQEGIDLIERLASASGKEAKAIGRTITGLNVDEWNKDSSNVMQDYIYFSFEQNPDALQLLLNTGNATLTHTQDKSKWGKEFPRILMEVREDFKSSSVTKQQPTQQAELLYGNIYANQSQTAAINNFRDFIKDNSEKYFTLKGRGGTGKSTIAGKMIEEATKEGYSVYGTAVSDAATSNLIDLTNNYPSASIFIANFASMYGLVPQYDNKGNQIGFDFPSSRSFNESKPKIEDSSRVLLVFDEASMVGDNILEKINKLTPNIKIIFMGDNAQIKPISEDSKISPVFKKFKYTSELTEVMRQKEGSPILHIATQIAKSIDNYDFVSKSTPLPNVTDEVFEYFDDQNNEGVKLTKTEKEFLDNAVLDYNMYSSKDTLIITGNNNNVQRFNNEVRKRVVNSTEPFVPGERLLTYSKFVADDVIINNSSIVYVKAPSGNIIIGGIKFPLVEIEYTKEDGSKGYTTVPLVLKQDTQAMSELNALKSKTYKEIRQRINYNQNRKLADQFNSIITVDYGYAMTAHKVQGQTIRNSYVYPEFRGFNKEETLRMFYTAITRPTSKLVIATSKTQNADKLKAFLGDDKPAKPKGGLGGGLEGGPMMGEPQLLPINEFVNAMLNKHYVNGVIMDKTALFRDVQDYNNTLGYEAVVVNKDLSITPNVSQALNAKNGVDYATSLLDRLSAKFNIPYVIDNTMPYKGKFMNGKVYINTRLMTDDTAYHEFAHPFIAAVKRINRPLYNNLIKEIKKEGKILAKTDKLYRKYFQEKGLTKQQVEAAIIEEAIVQALGEYAADANKMFDKSTGLFDALTRFFTFIKQSIKALFNKEKINIDAIPNDATLKELAIILASDIPLVNNTRMRNEVLDVLKQIDKCS
jgi:exodeoxyribonuclease-5